MRASCGADNAHVEASRASRFAFAIVATFCASLVACATAPQRQGTASSFSDSQRTLIGQNVTAEAMQLVTNVSPDGRDILHRASLDVDVTDADLPILIARMQATLSREQGVGIAAPQVGINRRVIIVKRLDKAAPEPFEIYRNPYIVEYSKDKVLDWEGCLSVPAGFGRVERARQILVKYTDPEGLLQHEQVEGYTARIFQHEIDHLDGVLFIDRRQPGELIPEVEYRAMRAKQKQTEATTLPSHSPAAINDNAGAVPGNKDMALENNTPK